MGREIYSFEMVHQISKQYGSRPEFRLKNPHIYKLASARKWLDLVCTHMKKPETFKWTAEEEKYLIENCEK